MPVPLPLDRPIRWGILGAGRIAATVAYDIVRTDGNIVVAVGARDGERAADFGNRFGAQRSYGSYDELIADDEVDVVYIATTNPGHHEQALSVIAAGKHLLIEKPVCLNATDTAEVLDAALAADVFAMEAMWMRTNPLIRRAEHLVADGAIGEVRGVRAEFGLGKAFDPTDRLYDLDNGGGALLDLGVYCVTFARLFLGEPDSVDTVGSVASTGSDATAAMQWRFGDGREAQLWCSAETAAPNRGLIQGSTGWIATVGEFHRPRGLIVHHAGGEEVLPDPIPGGSHGYGPEIAEVDRCLRTGLAESPLVPHADTVATMRLLDDARRVLGVRYPGEAGTGP
ncbi:MAG: gfo/Idh/MocA family oxidoreductase [Frankiales bacterium]|nr:gfo/Idh/MocA family oxidoreductase [Frankiales bacterium]